MQLQTFINTSLAEVWRQQGEAPDWARLYTRRESYQTGVAPTGALLLTAGVDVQRDRLECEVIAWGRDRESWSIDYRVIAGDPADCSADGPWWTRGGLHELLKTEWPTESGGRIRIMCMAIDSGDRPAPIYDFGRKHPQPIYGPTGSHCPTYGCVAVVKGTDAADRLITAVSSADVARQVRGGVRIFHVGTYYAKQELYDSLRLEPIPGDEQEPTTYPGGYCHFPSYDQSYFQGLTSEARVVRTTGRVEWVKDPSVRNEPLDCRVYGRVASAICGIDRFRESDWLKLAEHSRPQADPTLPDSGGGAPASAPIRRLRGRWQV
jgi:phage terminase large subunit GpA-like protein